MSYIALGMIFLVWLFVFLCFIFYIKNKINFLKKEDKIVIAIFIIFSITILSVIRIF